MNRVRKEITASLLASFGSDARGTRDASAYTDLLVRVIDEWPETHARDFPHGDDALDVETRFTRAIVRAYDAMGGRATFGRARAVDSRRTLVALAVAAGLPRRAWRRGDASERRRRLVRRYAPPDGGRFDPKTHRYAVYENVLTDAHVSTLRRAAVDALAREPERVRNEHPDRAVTKTKKTSARRVDCASNRVYAPATAALRRANVDIARVMISKGWLAEGFHAATTPRGSSFIYCKRGRAGKERQQAWHLDYPQGVDGAEYLSVIVALDDGVFVPCVGDADARVPLPSVVTTSTPATARVPVPRGGCIVFRGDHVHAGMRDVGVAAYRIHVYVASANVPAATFEPPGEVYFVVDR